jgi:cystathionine beta-synthase
MQGIKQLQELGEFDENSKVVVIFPDHGSRYMSKIYSDEWMEAQGFLEAKNEVETSAIEIIK